MYYDKNIIITEFSSRNSTIILNIFYLYDILYSRKRKRKTVFVIVIMNKNYFFRTKIFKTELMFRDLMFSVVDSGHSPLSQIS